MAIESSRASGDSGGSPGSVLPCVARFRINQGGLCNVRTLRKHEA